MKVRTFDKSTLFRESIDSVFSFFCQAENLQKITPPWLNFKILTPLPIKMQLGAKIEYQLKLYGFPVNWRTEITAWEPPYMFEDTQVSGPYRQWIHRHTFQDHQDGTLMHDQVHYAAPGWIFEPLVNRFFVGPNVEKIFSYRQRQLAELFSSREISN